MCVRRYKFAYSHVDDGTEPLVLVSVPTSRRAASAQLPQPVQLEGVRSSAARLRTAFGRMLWGGIEHIALD